MKKLEKGYLKYETTMTYAYEKDGELTINPSSTEIFSKVADDEQAILSVFYEPFETTTGTKQFVEYRYRHIYFNTLLTRIKRQRYKVQLKRNIFTKSKLR